MRYLPLVVLFTACGSAPLGAVHPEFAETVVRTKSTVKAGVYLAPNGRIRSLAVYHQDVAAIPKPVLALGAKHFAGKPVKYYETEWYPDAGLVYEVEYDLGNDTSGEISAQADGTLVYVEKPVAQVPPKIAKAAIAAAGGGEIIGAERQLGPGLDHFGIKVSHAGRKHVLLIKPDGRVVRHGLRVPAQIEVPFTVK